MNRNETNINENAMGMKKSESEGEGTLKDGQKKILILRDKIEFKELNNNNNIKQANLRKIEFEKLNVKKLKANVFESFSSLTVIIFSRN